MTRLRTAWDPRMNYAPAERLRLTREAWWRWLAHRLPRRLAYWTVIDMTARHTAEHPDAVVPEVTAMEVLGP